MPAAMAITFLSAPPISEPHDVGVGVDAEQVGVEAPPQLAGR